MFNRTWLDYDNIFIEAVQKVTRALKIQNIKIRTVLSQKQSTTNRATEFALFTKLLLPDDLR